MKENHIEFISSDGTNISGILTRPDGLPAGAVILVHGIAVEKNEGGFYSKLADILADSNLESLRFDFRGHGDSKGKPQDMTIQGEIEDLNAAIDLLCGRGFRRVAIVGTSFGGGVAVLSSAKRPYSVSSLALLSPVLDYGRTFLKPETEWAQEWFTEAGLKNALDTGIFNLDGFHLGRQLLQEFKQLCPGEVLASLTVPTLVIHGTDDSMVPYDVAREFSSMSDKSRFISIEGADHGFEGFEDQIFSEVCKWILRHLGE